MDTVTSLIYYVKRQIMLFLNEIYVFLRDFELCKTYVFLRVFYPAPDLVKKGGILSKIAGKKQLPPP